MTQVLAGMPTFDEVGPLAGLRTLPLPAAGNRGGRSVFVV